MVDDDVDLSLDTVFTEPIGPPTPEPTTSTYTRPDENVGVGDDGWREIHIRLVDEHPLWGHYLWNAARAFATYLDTHDDLCSGRLVLELGAGGALPSIVTARNGARKVVVTDYPDLELVKNMEYNVEANIPVNQRDRLTVQGYIWGHPVKPLLDALPTPSCKFDLIIMSDLIFNHSQHDALLKTCEEALSFDSLGALPPSVLVFYTHHLPHLAHRDMNFYTNARERGAQVFYRALPSTTVQGLPCMGDYRASLPCGEVYHARSIGLTLNGFERVWQW